MKRTPILAILLASYPAGCGPPARDSEPEPSAAKATGEIIAAAAAKETDADTPGLHNLMKVSDQIYSGSEPHGEEGFKSLADLGIKTIVSVDGAVPNIELANKHELRYVHIPIGYDGVSDVAGKALTRLVRDAEGAFYIHCHHGRHRGPAAAAVACVASEEVEGKEALKILQRAGTSKDYAGLWRDVEAFKPPAAHTELPPLVEVADIGSFATTMAKLDRSYDSLKLCREAKWNVPDDHPDLVPAHEALILRECLHEARRNLAEKYDDQFRAWLSDAEAFADNVERALKAGRRTEADEHFDRLQNSCKQCHEKYRN